MKLALYTALVIASQVWAQDVDTVLVKDANRKYSLVSQIEDPAEAEAFLNMVSAPRSENRNALAQRFVQQYPQSWALAQAFDVLARSAVDLGQMEEALRAGVFSLRLLPENASLLILVANLEVRAGNLDKAVQHGQRALEYLDMAERPGNVSEAEWTELRPQLKASAYFAKARAEATRGQTAGNQQALEDLNHAAAWNRHDAEVFYLRAIVGARLGNNLEAAADAKYVAQSDGPWAAKGRLLLNALASKVSISNLPAPAVEVELRRSPRLAQFSAEALKYGYAGPQACKPCHAKEFAAWQSTGMARMLQPYRAENIMGDFAAADLGSIHLGIAARPYFEIDRTRYSVDYTIGSKWQQAYATKLPDGRLAVLPIEYNALQKKWVNYWAIIDPPGSVRADVAQFPKLSGATNYQQNCAICHTSQLKFDAAASDPVQHASFLQPGIDCEMCHGPGALHSKQAAKGDASALFDFRTADNRSAVRVCAQCHRQSAVREMGDNGEMNYSTKEHFVPASTLRPFDAFSRKAFYKDGRFRETTFIVEAFTRSACFLRGTAQCATCHSPHLGDFATNQTALKYKDQPNEMCLQCHGELRARMAAHTRHRAGTEASECVTCHMPKLMNALLFKARSHEIEIPTADLTERFGQAESPNVCLTCHAEKPVLWAKEQLAAWQQ